MLFSWAEPGVAFRLGRGKDKAPPAGPRCPRKGFMPLSVVLFGAVLFGFGTDPSAARVRGWGCSYPNDMDVSPGASGVGSEPDSALHQHPGVGGSHGRRPGRTRSHFEYGYSYNPQPKKNSPPKRVPPGTCGPGDTSEESRPSTTRGWPFRPERNTSGEGGGSGDERQGDAMTQSASLRHCVTASLRNCVIASLRHFPINSL